MQSAKTDRVTGVLVAPRVGSDAQAMLRLSSVSDVELVSSIGDVSASQVEQMLDVVEGVGGLIGLSVRGLVNTGLPRHAAIQLAAAVELSIRLAQIESLKTPVLGDPQAVARYLFLRYRKPMQEVMGAVFLNQRNRVLSDRVFFVGTLTRAAVEPRPILREGLCRGAAGIILFHTHPSGDPEPSAEDMNFTKRLAHAGEIMGIGLVDHLVLGSPNDWVSLRERGGW